MAKNLKRVGAKVDVKRITRGDRSTFVSGKVVAVQTTQKGDWFVVDITPKGVKRGSPRQILKARAAQLYAPLA